MASAYLNPAIIADSVPEPQPVQQPLALAEGVARVQQLQRQNQQAASLAPIQQQQAQANLQGSQLANQQTQQELDDQKSFQQALAQSGGDPDKLEAATGAISSPRVRLSLENTISQMRQRNAATTEKQHQDYAQQSELYAGRLDSIINASDSNTKTALWGKFVNDASQMKDAQGNPLVPAGTLDPNTVPDTGTLGLLKNHLDATGAFNAKQAATKKASADAAKAQVEADNQAYTGAVQAMPTDQTDPDIQAKWTAWRNSLPISKQSGVPAQFSPTAVANVKLTTVPTADQPEFLIKKRQSDAVQNMTPQSVEQSIAGVINPAQHPADFKDALNRAMLNYNAGSLTPALTDAIAKEYTDKYATQRSEVSRATDPALISAEVNKSVAIQNALKRSDNPALANVPTASVKDVQDKAYKLEQDYSKAKAATDTLGRVLDLADQGNAVAGTNIASLGSAGVNAVNGIKRINPSSVEGYGNAGSLLDTVKGKLDKWDGKGPLDQNLLDQIRELHQTLGEQATQTYNDGYKSLKSVYNADLKPTQAPPNIRKSITVTDPSGGVHTFPDQASADRFKKLAHIQ